MDEIIEQARERELARIDAECRAAQRSADVLAIVSLRALQKAVLRPGWTPERGPRRMPSLWQVASYWVTRDTFGKFDLDDTPHCFRCLRDVPDDLHDPDPRKWWNKASGYLDRAHLVDRCDGGLDGPQNLVPLCHECHGEMPEFRTEQGQEAIAWVMAGWELCRWVKKTA